jgi:hypothetical protein
MRIMIVSDHVNPHGLSSAELTEPGDLAAAFNNPASGLLLDAAPAAVLEIDTNDLHLATAALNVPSADPAAYDVLVYFAHRIPDDAGPVQNQADQDAFVAAVEAFVVAGGGVVCFHHGAYQATGKDGMLDLIGGVASSVEWNTSSGQNIINVAPNHFITTHSIEYSGQLSYADAAHGVPAATYDAFQNLPDERYPAFSLLPTGGSFQMLFASDYANNGSTHILGFSHRQPSWQGVVVVYQPGEYQPQALDDFAGNNFQVLANALVYAAFQCAPGASSSNYGSGWPGTLGVPTLTGLNEPRLCQDLTLEIGNSQNVATTALLLVGVGRSQLPTAWGGTIVVSTPWSMRFLPLPAAGLSLTGPMECNALLCGLEVNLQCLMADPGASNQVAFSQGLALQLGF